MEIRKPNDDEVQKLLSLAPQALFEGTLGEAKLSDEKAKQLIEPLLQKGSYYVIAAEGDDLMGWVLVGASKDHFTEKKSGFIYELFVIEPYRGRGIAEQLMKSAVGYLQQDGYSEVRLSVYAGNHAIKLYEKLGFVTKTVTMSMNV